jgi:hypothetical protein
LHSSYRTSPKWTISSRVPPREIGKGMPGPGNYGVTSVEKDKYGCDPKYSIAAGNRDGKEWAPLPGPGQYAPKLAGKSMPKWAFGSESRLKEVQRSRTPGPGTYDTRGNLEGLQFSVSTRPGGRSKSSTPGPGQYKPHTANHLQFESAPKASFGASSRSELVPSKSPGPGAYEAWSVLGGSCNCRSMPRYTICGKRPEPQTQTTPGPGASATQFSR